MYGFQIFCPQINLLAQIPDLEIKMLMCAIGRPRFEPQLLNDLTSVTVYTGRQLVVDQVFAIHLDSVPVSASTQSSNGWLVMSKPEYGSSLFVFPSQKQTSLSFH